MQAKQKLFFFCLHQTDGVRPSHNEIKNFFNKLTIKNCQSFMSNVTYSHRIRIKPTQISSKYTYRNFSRGMFFGIYK